MGLRALQVLSGVVLGLAIIGAGYSAWVLTRSEVYTLQVGLNAFQGELQVQWHYVLAMTVVTLLPVALVFAFLQRFITTGIASAGVK